MAASGAPVVLITGCTEGGIGHALAIYLHCKGCRVFGTVRRREAAPKLEEIGVALLALDVTDDAQCAAAVAHVLEVGVLVLCVCLCVFGCVVCVLVCCVCLCVVG